MKFSDLKPGQHFYVVMNGMRGWFAVNMWINGEEEFGPFPEPWDSDIMSYDTREEAEIRAKELAAEDNVPFIGKED